MGFGQGKGRMGPQVPMALLEIVAGICMAVIGFFGVLAFDIQSSNGIRSSILSVYFLIFGIATVLVGLIGPGFIVNHLDFFKSWFGKGAWMLFVGLLTFNGTGGIGFILTLVCLASSLLFFVFHCMRDKLGQPSPLLGSY